MREPRQLQYSLNFCITGCILESLLTKINSNRLQQHFLAPLNNDPFFFFNMILQDFNVLPTITYTYFQYSSKMQAVLSVYRSFASSMIQALSSLFLSSKYWSSFVSNVSRNALVFVMIFRIFFAMWNESLQSRKPIFFRCVL